MIRLEKTPRHSHVHHFLNFKWLWYIFYENIIEKYFVLPRLQKQQEMANKEREMNLLKVRKNDPHVNRSRVKVITNERYEKID